jgi:hypothetical protein
MATVRKRTWESGGKTKTAWLVDYRDQAGGRRFRTFVHKRDAEDWLAHEPVRRFVPKALRGRPLLLSEIRQLPELSIGIYFLFQGDALQYIGQSSAVYERVSTHRRQRKIPFDNWRFVNTTLAELDTVEATYIHAFRPPYNRGPYNRGQHRSNDGNGPQAFDFA